MTSEPSHPTLPSTCPSCGATVRSDVSWCTQCYAPLLQEPDAQPSQDEQARGMPDEDRSLAEPEHPVDAAEVDRLAAQMLAQLAAQPDELRGLTSRLPSAAATRALAVAAVIVVGSGLVLAVMFVVGSAL